MNKLAEPDSSIQLGMVEAVETWLREEVAAGHLEYLADPSKAIPADRILPCIKARRAAESAR